MGAEKETRRSCDYNRVKPVSGGHGQIIPETRQERTCCCAVALSGVALMFGAFWLMGAAAVIA